MREDVRAFWEGSVLVDEQTILHTTKPVRERLVGRPPHFCRLRVEAHDPQMRAAEDVEGPHLSNQGSWGSVLVLRVVAVNLLGLGREEGPESR